ncbi:LysR family transcriptional regulator [Kordiimonas gwangyangensis]|uniref:LysR family transcriptional regulator n=2 Tax=Kordiimonas gwangyangensis TaxID=288022 RepID=UPI0009D9E312|nr:LysR family transcriptional regulator [Kordiimonas gwangyangensis]
MNLAGIDLNLLVVFNAVMDERNATRAGRKIGMSQPAVSNALNRLRYLMKDDLFVRGPDGMRPTARALELEIPVRRALSELEEALDPVSFDPRNAERTFTIATDDYMAMTLLPYLSSYLVNEAPGVNIHTTPVQGRLFEKLDAQEADYGLAPMGDDVPERFGRMEVGTDHFVCLMRTDHPLAQYDEIPLEEYAAARHMLVSPRGDPRGFVDEQLEAMGMSRRLVMVVNHFGSAPMIISSSDLIVTVPSRMADKCTEFFDLHVVPSPISPPPGMVGAVLVWHKRLTNHPAHTWFRDQILRASRDLDEHGLKRPDNLLHGRQCMAEGLPKGTSMSVREVAAQAAVNKRPAE